MSRFSRLVTNLKAPSQIPILLVVQVNTKKRKNIMIVILQVVLISALCVVLCLLETINAKTSDGNPKHNTFLWKINDSIQLQRHQPYLDVRGGGSTTRSTNDDDDDDESSSVDNTKTEVLVDNTDNNNNHHNWYDTIQEGPADTILGIAQKYNECTNSNKVNLVIGAYRNENGIPWILPSVYKVQEQILQLSKTNIQKYNKEYLPIEGDTEFIQCAIQFAFGTDLCNQLNIIGVQTLSGTGACRIVGQFLSNHYCTTTNNKNIFIPIPTWMNHYKIFDSCQLITNSYQYYDSTNHCIDIDNLLNDLSNASNGSIIILHACAHNPTGCDPTIEQWERILSIIQSKNHLPFFDCAYQGFATGDSIQDSYVLRMFANAIVQNKLPQGMVLAQSFAKNFGLYGDRVGCASIIVPKSNTVEETIQIKNSILSQLKQIIRPMYSSPPKHGSTIVKTILNDVQLSKQYHTECQLMSTRIHTMRIKLVKILHELQQNQDTGIELKKDWSYISTKQIGMFAYTGLTCDQVDILMNKYSIYMTRDGRISLAGLNDSNIHYVAQAIHNTVVVADMDEK